ncbi:Abortive infection protein [Haladaptatus sp. W1]|uniref:CPBP family intramembrane glutamic endopeptidase n=1 Tax=Haladaptatus sp. W1 TaxID=1897478 RepID=UPI000849D215|nr:CPBP family intramembrane glutamic endopeptidase [Haladaptatus sp. W1]ODR83512.1 Abortive infection protein [Haladaptatus sp. W1]
MHTPESATERTRRRSFLEGALVTFLLGLPGIVAVGASLLDELRALPQFADTPTPSLFFIGIAQPLVLLALACLVGTALAPRVKLHSHVLYRLVGRTQPPVLFAEELPAAVGVGVALAVTVLALDGALAVVAPDLPSLGVAGGFHSTVFSVIATVPTRFLYGGITEELLVRYGFMTLVVWLVWKLVGGDRPSSGVMWTAVVVSALAFGAGHLPVLSTSPAFTPALGALAVSLNALVGVGLGWLYWQGSLESAMVGHVTFHVVVVLVSLGTVL